ncbi:MAG TPA: TIGR00730 family Rossman fold protein [Caulobacteraceae bacterium]|nr:TIGR00730 family Rossman fold protein [Caulobacteraceae bacterium]
MSTASRRPESVCLYCGSSNDADPRYLAAATTFGREIAQAGLKLVYGGGGVGLMGAAARAAHEAGGKVLGIMPEFLRGREMLFDDVETIVVSNMHERKMIMFEQSDAFVVMPGGIGTLEEIVELLSWRRLDLHVKPVVFANLDGFWNPLFELFEHTIEAKLTPPSFRNAWISVDSVEQIVPALLRPAEAA